MSGSCFSFEELRTGRLFLVVVENHGEWPAHGYGFGSLDLVGQNMSFTLRTHSGERKTWHVSMNSKHSLLVQFLSNDLPVFAEKEYNTTNICNSICMRWFLLGGWCYLCWELGVTPSHQRVTVTTRALSRFWGGSLQLPLLCLWVVCRKLTISDGRPRVYASREPTRCRQIPTTVLHIQMLLSLSLERYVTMWR
jgi:hypothetical protein